MLKEPTKDILEKENFLIFRELEKRPGRRRIKNIVRVRPGPKRGYEKEETEEETVLVHILRSIESQKTLYAKISRTMKGFYPRIYKPSEKVWRDMNFAEVEVYIGLIQSINEERIKEFEKGKRIYGIISDDTFWIVHKTQEEEEIKDTRKKARGRICKNYKKQALIDIVEELRAEGYKVPNITNSSKDDMCKALERFFQENNLLYKL
jgi:hypothetical protein